jgi:hypothetical protein
LEVKPPPLVDVHISAALGTNGAAYAVRLTSGNHTKAHESLTAGTLRDALRDGIVAALDALKYSSTVTLYVPTGETVTSIRDLLDVGEPKRAASRHRVTVRFEWPAQVDRELKARAREVVGPLTVTRDDTDEPRKTWRK